MVLWIFRELWAIRRMLSGTVGENQIFYLVVLRERPEICEKEWRTFEIALQLFFVTLAQSSISSVNIRCENTLVEFLNLKGIQRLP